MAKAILEVKNSTSLAFTIIEKNGKETKETEIVEIKLNQLRPRLFLLTWKEKNGNTVTQVQDHKNKKAFMNWTQPDGQFINAEAEIKSFKG